MGDSVYKLHKQPADREVQPHLSNRRIRPARRRQGVNKNIDKDTHSGINNDRPINRNEHSLKWTKAVSNANGCGGVIHNIRFQILVRSVVW